MTDSRWEVQRFGKRINLHSYKAADDLASELLNCDAKESFVKEMLAMQTSHESFPNLTPRSAKSANQFPIYGVGTCVTFKAS